MGTLFDLNVYRGKHSLNLTIKAGAYSLSITAMNKERMLREHSERVKKERLELLREKGHEDIPRFNTSPTSP